MTVGGIKEVAFTKYGESRGIRNNPSRLPDPELYVLVVFDKTGFPLSPICRDDSQSLKDFLEDVDYFSHSPPTRVDMFPINVMIALECTWDDYEKVFTKVKNEREKSVHDIYQERYAEHDGYWTSDSESDSKFDSKFEIEEVTDRKRPLGSLEDDRGVLWVIGRLHVVELVDDHNNTKRRRVPCQGGLRCNLKNVVKMTTTAKHVLLVFTDNTLNVLASYHALLDKDIDNDPDDNILVLLLTWDSLSYLLLRKLRKDVGPNVPFIALTESHLNELDLMAFLDTPPSQVASFYGWDDDLYRECADLKLDDVVVDIKWAGIWPSELLHICNTIAFDSCPFSIHSKYYRFICDSLKKHPQLRANPSWLKQLLVFDKHPLYAHFLGVDCPRFGDYFEQEYFPKKLANKEWI